MCLSEGKVPIRAIIVIVLIVPTQLKLKFIPDANGMDIGFVAVMSVVEDVSNGKRVLFVELPISTYDEACFLCGTAILELRLDFVGCERCERTFLNVVLNADARAEQVVVLVVLMVFADFTLHPVIAAKGISGSIAREALRHFVAVADALNVLAHGVRVLITLAE